MPDFEIPDEVPAPVQVDPPTPAPPEEDQVPNMSDVDWSKYNEGGDDNGA